VIDGYAAVAADRAQVLNSPSRAHTRHRDAAGDRLGEVLRTFTALYDPGEIAMESQSAPSECLGRSGLPRRRRVRC